MRIIVLHDPAKRSPYFEAYSKALHLQHISIEIRNNLPPAVSPTERTIIQFHRLGRVIDLYNNPETLLTQILSYKRLGFEFSWTIHNIIPLDYSDEKIDWFKLFLSRFVLLMDFIFTHTDEMKRQFELHFPPAKAIVIGFGADYHLIDNNPPKRLDIDFFPGFTFLFVGHLRHYKGIINLIHAFDVVKKKHDDLRLILAGPQYLNCIGQSIKDAINVMSNVFLIDKYIYSHEYLQLISIADAMVFPFDVNLKVFQYGFYSASIAEAAFMGKYMIVPECASIKSILNTFDYCCTYNPGDENHLGQALDKTIGMSSLVRSEAGNRLREAMQHNTWDSYVKHLIAALS